MRFFFCPLCENLFETENPQKIYCSKRCCSRAFYEKQQMQLVTKSAVLRDPPEPETLPTDPTPWPPGSPQRIRVQNARAAAKVAVYHRDDAKLEDLPAELQADAYGRQPKRRTTMFRPRSVFNRLTPQQEAELLELARRTRGGWDLSQWEEALG